MYEYSFESGVIGSRKEKFSIATPKVKDVSDIKVEVIEQTPTLIHSKSTFPDGLTMETKTWSNRVELTTNREIRILEDGSMSLELDN